MNTVDLLILIIVAFNGLLGLVRGAIWQILRLVSIVLGLWAAARYGREFLALFPSSLDISAEMGIHVARIVLFLSVYLVMFGVTNLAQSLVRKVKLGGVDRSLGALLGAGKGAALCCLVLYLQFLPGIRDLDLVKDQLQGNVERAIPASRANPFFLDQVHPRVRALFDEKQRDEIDRKLEELEETMKASDALSGH